MIPKFKNWKIVNKLLFAFIIILMCFIIIGSLTTWNSFLIQNKSYNVERVYFSGVNITTSMKTTLFRIEHEFDTLVAHHDKDAMKNILIHREKFEILIEEFKSVIPEGHSLNSQLALVKELFRNYQDIIDKLDEADKHSDFESFLLQAKNILKDHPTHLFDEIEDVYNENVALLSEAIGNIYDVSTSNRQIFLITMLGMVFFILITYLYVIRAIVVPLKKLVTGTKEVARNNFLVRVKIDSKDEIGELSESFNKMTAEIESEQSRLEDEIIKHKQTAQELRETKELSETVFNNTNDAMMVVEVDTYKVIDVNNSMLKMLKKEKLNVLGRKCHSVIHTEQDPCKSAKINCPIKDIAINRVHKRIEYEFIDIDGKKLYYEISATPLMDEKGKINHAIVVYRNITARKDYEISLKLAKQQAEAMNVSKSHFIANVSHELRTPLNGIIGFAEMIGESDNIPEIQKQSKIILNESEHLLQLINNLLDIAKIEAGKMDLEKTPFDLAALIESIISLIRNSAKEKKIEINYKMPLDFNEEILGDPLRTRQIILNIMNNAVKFTEKGSVSLIVDVSEKDDRKAKLKFTVKDTGIGIPKQKINDVFKSFVQVDVSTSRKFGGTGLGMAIVKDLVKLMNGEIGIDSEVNQGTTIWFEIPVEISSKKQAQIQDISKIIDINQMLAVINASNKKFKILLADDYFPNQQLVSQHISHLGYSVDIVNNGEEAIEYSNKNKYDLILMDVQMPKLNGFQATIKIRNDEGVNVNVPIVALTADAYEGTRKTCHDVGMNDVLVKPFRKDDFIRLIYIWLFATDEVREHFKADAILRKTKSEIQEQENNMENPINDALLLKEFNNDKNKFVEFIRKFISIMEEQLKELKSVVEIKDIDAIKKEAHRLKGGTSSFTAAGLSKVVNKLEKSSENGNMIEIKNAVVEFEKELKILENYISTKFSS